MGGFELRPIKPNGDNAKQLLGLLNEDFSRLPTLAANDARQMADPGSDEQVAEQFEALCERPHEYFSIHGKDDGPGQDERWVGALKQADWLYGDEERFVPATTHLKQRIAHYLKKDVRLEEGLFAFARSEDIPDESLIELTGHFLELAIEQARSRGRQVLKCAVDLEDTSLHYAFDNHPPLAIDGKQGAIALKGIERVYRLRAVKI